MYDSENASEGIADRDRKIWEGMGRDGKRKTSVIKSNRGDI
jgi:hypothetical protein